MNAAHFHLVVNHFPIIVPMVGVLVMLMGFMFSSDAVKRTALVLFALGAAATVAAVLSGEEAEEMVENLPGVAESFIDIHEEKAQVFSVLSYILGVASLIGLWVSFKLVRWARWAYVKILLLALVVLYFAKETGTSGGEIRHSEIRRAGAPAAVPAEGAAPAPATEEED